MKAVALAAAALGVFALSSWSPPANAATCYREVVNGPTGQRELVRGCYTRERLATRAPRRTVTTTQTVTERLLHGRAPLRDDRHPGVCLGAGEPCL